MTPEQLLMQELKDVMDGANKSLEQEERDEMVEILRLTSRAFDKELSDGLSHLFVMNEVSAEEAMMEEDNSITIDRDIPDRESQNVSGAKVKHIAEMPDAEALMEALGDQRAMTLIASMDEPIGLIFRTTTDSGLVTAMALPMGVAIERRRNDGKVMRNAYRYDDGKPDDVDTYSEQEMDLMRYLCQALMMPRLFRSKYPEAFRALARQIRDEFEAEFGDKDDE
jgi:hypothetical protein